MLFRNVLSSVLFIALSVAPLRGEGASSPSRTTDESSLLGRIRYKIAHSRIASSVLRSVSCGLAALFWFQQAHNFGVLSEDESVKGRLLYGLPLLGLTGLSAWNVVRTYEECKDTASSEFEVIGQINNVVGQIQKEVEPLFGITDVVLFTDALEKNTSIIPKVDSTFRVEQLLGSYGALHEKIVFDPVSSFIAFLMRLQKAKQDMQRLSEKYGIVLDDTQRECIKRIEVVSAYAMAHRNEIENCLIGHLVSQTIRIITVLWEPFLKVAHDTNSLRKLMPLRIVDGKSFHGRNEIAPITTVVECLSECINRSTYLKNTYDIHQDSLKTTIGSLLSLKQKIQADFSVEMSAEAALLRAEDNLRRTEDALRRAENALRRAESARCSAEAALSLYRLNR